MHLKLRPTKKRKSLLGSGNSNSYATGAVTTSNSTALAIPNSGGLVGTQNSAVTTATDSLRPRQQEYWRVRRVSPYECNHQWNQLLCGQLWHKRTRDLLRTTCTQKTLAELQALTSTDVTDWSTDNWDFGTTTQLPRLKYAPTATYCTDTDYTTQQTCEDASESWVVEGCDGDTGVTCGDVIPGQ